MNEARDRTTGSAPLIRRRPWAIIAALLVVLILAAAIWVLTRPRPPAGVEKAAPDGGSQFYDRFGHGLSYDGSFPLGVWLESVKSADDVAKDRAAGLNTYVGLTDDSLVDEARAGGMSVFLTKSTPASDKGDHQGWLISDEADMWAGAGDAAWTGKFAGQGQICDPPGAKCGYTAQQKLVDELPDDGRIRYANYGKGLLFWATPQEAKRFASSYQDIVSVDAYWYTDSNLCRPGEGGRLLGGGKELDADRCHRAINYGESVRRARSAVDPAGSRPVWSFVELARPFPHSSRPGITPTQVRAAVWQSIIHGARGIVYFNHSFVGPCQSAHVLRDACYAGIRTAVTDVNQQVTRLAPVLAGDDVRELFTVDNQVAAMVKVAGDDLYVFAGGRSEAADRRATLTSACDWEGTVEVVDEQRTLPLEGRRLTDRFADHEAIHIYRLPGAAGACGLS